MSESVFSPLRRKLYTPELSIDGKGMPFILGKQFLLFLQVQECPRLFSPSLIFLLFIPSHLL